VVDLRDVASDWHVVEPGEVEERLPGPLEPGDALILRYGWQRYGKGHEDEDAERYFNRHPGPGRALVDWVLERELAWVGTDAASFEHPANINLRSARPDLVPALEEAVDGTETFDSDSWMVAHRRLLERGVLHVDQAGGALDAVPAERVTLAIFPWRYSGGEASICRLIAIV
jgi:kynurenine formamidase